MSESLSLLLAGAVAVAFLAGLYGERWRSRLGRRSWRIPPARKQFASVHLVDATPTGPITDSADQLRIVMGARFERRRLLTKSEARVFYAAEKAVRDQKLAWRVMAQVSLGEILSSPDARAYGAINSKRVDVLLISASGDPLAAIEYQGGGHYQGTAPARDAVKKEALRRAGVRYIEITPEHDAADVAREIARVAAADVRPGSS
ncbi:DUF2726 domain-containing protein [Phenylobacterium sp.]|uniref:DUF2726 domain-containing protein n=1 Tax=Phenylobacterium sp. TaxID=1871053 RepID=UPI002732FD6B|nr:DUF2726 domain-containing protein [Phenylobacterium sp.]MDP3853907.1 DUF2726 domain-containing protein [Phenylobacterium sp.]